MPRYYRDQFKPWGRGQCVVVLYPSDLNTINALTRGRGSPLSPEASLTLAAHRINKLLARLTAGGTL